MGLQSIPAYARVLSHPEITDRNVSAAIFGERSGGVRPGDFAITPTGVTRQFTVAAGQAYIQGRENAQQGGYVAWSDVSENLLLSAPAASPRIDTLLLRIYDEQYGTLPSGTSRAQWDIVNGVAAASPNVRPDSDFLSGGSQYVPGAWWRVADFRSNPGDTTIPLGQIYPTLTHARVGGTTYGNLALSTTGFGGRPTDATAGDRFYDLAGRLWYTWNTSLSKWIREDEWKAETVSTPVSSNTQINAPNLWFDGEANARYIFDFHAMYTALGVPGFSLGLTFPAGCTVQYMRDGMGHNSSAYYNDALNTIGSGQGFSGGVQSNSFGNLRVGGTVLFGATAGRFQGRAAQSNTDAANPSYLLAGSWAQFKQVG